MGSLCCSTDPQKGPMGPHGVSVGSLHCLIGPQIDLCVPKEDLQSPWCPTGPHADLGVPMVDNRSPEMTYISPGMSMGSPWWPTGAHVDLGLPVVV